MRKNKLLLLLALLLTAATGAWAETGMINGLFSVSPTKRVYFSKGNLQYDGTNWKFAENQWEVLGANGTGAIGTATNYPMDFFTWGNIDSPTYNGTTYYTENADLSGITDWGSRMGSGWYTLSKDEWLYLFGMESSNTDKSGHARYRKYFRATVNGLPGIVLLPDDLSGISDIPAESSRGTASNFAKTYTTDAWSAMESAGCVFLPTAGFRKTDASVSHVGWSGFYWESTAYDAGKAYTVGFDNTFVDPAGNFDRTFGFAVRLVIDQYYLTLADGVKDADKWTVKVGEGQAQALPIGGLKGDGSETVTLQYNGRLKVKGVKAVAEAAPSVPDGALSGNFSVSDTKQVNFSKGNLQLVGENTLQFAENQWDYFGINQSDNHRDLLCWGTGNNPNQTTGNSTFTDWGDNTYLQATLGKGWRTMTKDEFAYVFNTRASGSSVFGNANGRYTTATINTDGTGVKGIILFPDGITIAASEVTTAGTINSTSTVTQCTTAQWAALAEKGCVFLPAAGFILSGSGIGHGDISDYWTSTAADASKAYNLGFNFGVPGAVVNTAGTLGYNYGLSVRLVREVATSEAAQAKPLTNATTEDLGKVVGADGNIYANKAAAEAVATGNAVAMIAYVGTASDCTHGLAIALADESGSKNYGAAGTACSGKAAVTGGTWRLPSIKDWQYMFIGCGASGSYSDIPSSMSYSGLASKLTTAQGDALQPGYYWSSTEYFPGTDAWDVGFDGSSNASFGPDDESIDSPRVRACLAF